MSEYKKIFGQFFRAACNEKEEGNFNPAVSNYYKALTALCSFLIKKKTNKIPKNHSEIFLFLEINFPNTKKIVDDMFEIYTDSYTNLKKDEDCGEIENAIREIIRAEKVEEDFEEYIKQK